MNDLISRQAAIEAIEPILKSILQGNSFKAINVMDKIRDLPSAQQWIPCSVRLPDDYGEFLITWQTAKVKRNFIGFAEGEPTQTWDDKKGQFVFSWIPDDFISERYPDYKVIAWMPLPPAFKEE